MRILLSIGDKNAPTIPYYVDSLKQFDVELVVSDKKETDDLTCDGVVFAGGVDINPKRYNKENIACGKIDDYRDEREFVLFNKYFEAKKPIMGICRGLQVINVALGGTLIQDLPTREKHTSKSVFEESIHKVLTVKGSILDRVYGEEFVSNSYHHQAIDILGKGLTITAYSYGDNVIEGVEMKDYPLLAVQYHPERACLSRANEYTNDSTPLLREYIKMVEKANEQYR